MAELRIPDIFFCAVIPSRADGEGSHNSSQITQAFMTVVTETIIVPPERRCCREILRFVQDDIFGFSAPTSSREENL
jgi:hypothetical protein